MKAKYPRLTVLPMPFELKISEDLASDAATRYDFSDYPLHHPLYNITNRKAPGFFKDELNTIPIREFVGLRPKCYAFHCTGEVEKNVIDLNEPIEKKTFFRYPCLT